MSYIVPIHRPSGVRHAIKLNFLGPDEDTLIVAKANRLEIYAQSPTEGFTLIHSKSIYGYISMLSSLRPAASATDHLFVGTDRYQYFTCSWDAEKKTLKTEQSYVDQADKSNRDTRQSDRCRIDPSGRYMTLELYDGIVSVVPVVQPSNKRVKRTSSAGISDVGTLGEPIQVRIEETLTRDSAFLEVDSDSKANPKLAILWEDNLDVPQLKIREMKPSTGSDPDVDLDTVSELRAELDLGVSHLIPVPVPYSGFLILGERSISYVDSKLTDIILSRDLEDNATIWTCWTKVDDTRWLLADDYGRLFFVMIETENGQVVGWRLDALGQTSKAACLVYLDEGVVFIGSHSGDSQIVRIVEGGVEVLQTFPNIAPILDLSIMDLGRSADNSQNSEYSTGQARIVAASGAWQDGSIRSVRSGVGMEEIGIIGDIQLINDLWALSSSGLDDTHDIILATFINETRIFKFDEEANVEELADFHNLECSEATIFATNLPDRKLLQVYERGVYIIDLESEMNIFSWKVEDSDTKITSACANGAHLVIIQGGITLHVFHIAGRSIPTPKSRQFPSDSQISSVAIPDSQSNVCVLSFWQTASITLFDIHSLEEIYTQSLGEPGRAVPRSLLVAQVLPGSPLSVFIAMADGSVMTYMLDPVKNTLSGMTRILLGSEPVVFKTLPRNTDDFQQLSNVFASCEQPSLIYASEGRIIYSAVNADKSSRVCHFNSEAYPGAVALATPTELKLAMVGTKRTTQLQTLSVGETVRCLAYEPRGKVFGLGCIRRMMYEGIEALMSSVKIATEIGFKELDSIELKDNELVECIISLPPTDEEEDNQTTLFVVGTSLDIDSQQYNAADQDRGRIIVYRVDPKRQRLKVVTEVQLRGACRSLAVCDGMIVAGLVKVVALYNFMPAREHGGRYTHELDRLATYRTSTNPLSLSIQPSTRTSPASIAVADLMKSLSVLHVLPPGDSKSGNWELQEIGRHFASVWSSATAAVGENEWVLADMDGNLAMLRRNTEAITFDDQRRLELTGEMRLGEIVNKIVPLTTTRVTPTGEGHSKGKERSRTLSTTAAKPNNLIQKGPESRTGPLIQPQAFLGTTEGAIYLLGSINTAYTDVLLRLQAALASKVQAPGYMPWTRYRAWKTEIRESDEPFRFVDGEMMEAGLLGLSSADLEVVMKEHGLMDSVTDGGLDLSVNEVRGWSEELRRLY